MTTTEEMRDDFKEILDEVGQTVTIYRPTLTNGSIGEIINTSTSYYNIKCDIQPISQKDQEFHNMGIFGVGDAKAYFKHEYDSDDDENISGTFTPQVGDIIKDSSGVYWRLETLMSSKPWEGNNIELTFHIRRIE